MKTTKKPTKKPIKKVVKKTTTKKVSNVKLVSEIEDLEYYNKTKKPIKIQFPFEVKFFTGNKNDYMVFKFGTGRNTTFGVFIPTYTTDSGKDVDLKLYEKLKNPTSFWKEVWEKKKYYSVVKQRKPRVKRPHGSSKIRRKRKVK